MATSETGFLPSLQTSLLVALLIRAAVGLSGYSGKGVAPMYGDFEAQRHWLEITVNLPPSSWYYFDLQYWGLDYPPLTAYHSWIFGMIARFINPEWIALSESRGFESNGITTFMRWTSVVTDASIYISAVVQFSRLFFNDNRKQKIFFLLASLQPALIIIDHGHFQYNSAMLGFALWAIISFKQQKYLLGSVCFCLSLNFKQMALYYALPVFFYLLGICRIRTDGATLFFKIGGVVIVTFLLCFAPFLHSFDNIFQVFRRLFPFERGLFEDKVANFWCAINVVMKLRKIFETSTLTKLSLVFTLMGVFPTSIDVFMNPTIEKLIYGMLNGSMAFFLFSFQVHEKSILLPLLLGTLLVLDETVWSFWFTNIAMFSMFPLLKRDNLVVPYFSLLILWNATVLRFVKIQLRSWQKYLLLSSFSLMIFIHILEFTITVPARYPDLFPVINAVLSFGHFGLFYMYFTYRQFTLSKDHKKKD